MILCLTGHPGDTDPGEARKVVVDGLRQAAKVAGEHGLTLGLEPLHRNVYGTWTMIGDIPGTIDLMDEIGEPNVKLLYDLYHLWDTDNVLEETVSHGDRIDPSVHVCDWREDTRNDFDRALPGDGIMDLPALFGALDAGGVVDWVDLEIFSDDGSFTDMDFEDSLWKQDPVDVCRRGKAGFVKAWAGEEGAVRLEGKVALVTGRRARAGHRSRHRARARGRGLRRRDQRRRRSRTWARSSPSSSARWAGGRCSSRPTSRIGRRWTR